MHWEYLYSYVLRVIIVWYTLGNFALIVLWIHVGWFWVINGLKPSEIKKEKKNKH